MQVKAGSLFDNILITDDPDYAKQVAEETTLKNKDVSFSFGAVFSAQLLR